MEPPSDGERSDGHPGPAQPVQSRPVQSQPDQPQPDQPQPPEDRTADETKAVLDEIERQLAGISRALDRLESGRYGRCELCDAEIDESQLGEDPTAERCAAHR